MVHGGAYVFSCSKVCHHGGTWWWQVLVGEGEREGEGGRRERLDLEKGDEVKNLIFFLSIEEDNEDNNSPNGHL